MSSSVISEGIMLIVVIIAASALSRVFMTTISDIQQNTVSTYNEIGDKIKTQIELLSAVNISETNVRIWVKNIGKQAIPQSSIQRSDLFFGEIGDFQRYNYNASGIGWKYIILNSDDTNWNPTETLEITLTLGISINQGDQYVSFSTYNGVRDEFYFTVGG